jgi:hypothetical protein
LPQPCRVGNNLCGQAVGCTGGLVVTVAGLNLWRIAALCDGAGIDFFDPAQERQAVRLCRGGRGDGPDDWPCPVFDECARYAARSKPSCGVWAGVCYGYENEHDGRRRTA